MLREESSSTSASAAPSEKPEVKVLLLTPDFRPVASTGFQPPLRPCSEQRMRDLKVPAPVYEKEVPFTDDTDTRPEGLL